MVHAGSDCVKDVRKLRTWKVSNNYVQQNQGFCNCEIRGRSIMMLENRQCENLIGH